MILLLHKLWDASRDLKRPVAAIGTDWHESLRYWLGIA